MRTVLTYGTFDLFHLGHLRLLEKAATLGDRLIVGISTDEFAAEKGKKVVVPFVERIAIVGALSCVDLTIAEESYEQKLSDIKRPTDIVVMGGDHFGQFDDLPCTVVYVSRTPNISTTKRKAALK